MPHFSFPFALLPCRLNRRVIALVVPAMLASFGLAAQPATDWFTVMGDLADPRADTVQLDITHVQPRGTVQLMNLRVNLAERRSAPGGEHYASYTSQLSIDCQRRAVEHVVQRRFDGPLWKGPSVVQEFLAGRPMAFGGLVPNPRERILKAACSPAH